MSVLTANQVVQILDETVDWYRTLGSQQQTASQPSDLLILYANRQTANQVIGLAFEFARANAELLSSEAGRARSAAAEASSAQVLQEQRSQLDVQKLGIQQEMEADRRDLAGGGNRSGELAAKLTELQGELDMVNARRNLLDTMAQFLNESDARGASANALKAHIDAIAASVPAQEAAAPPAAGSSGSAAVASTSHAPALGAIAATTRGSGIWELAASVMRLSAKVAMLDAIDKRTAALEQTFLKIRTAPLERLKALSAQSDALAAKADNANSATLKAVRDQFDTLAWLFKQTASILVPLSKEAVLLQQYRHNLANWRDIIKRQYHEELRALALRLGVLAALLAAVFGGAELWRRAVVRYAHEPRRRYQLLLVQKITLWTLVCVIIGFTFITELSSVATFAGLITAGIAVAMQSVLVSVVGYFLLIGKYGIRVGDRVQIGTVTGEVIDLGLVRMHLMELNPQGPLGPTGRIVAFANSIVFQASSGLFRQIPGVNFTWHEMALALPAGCDYSALKDRLLSAVSEAVKEYRDELVRQTRLLEKTTALNSNNNALPQVQLHFAATGVEALVRYPVNLEHQAEIDERVSRELLNVLKTAVAAISPPGQDMRPAETHVDRR